MSQMGEFSFEALMGKERPGSLHNVPIKPVASAKGKEIVKDSVIVTSNAM